jgi:1A family penicillin-binding protein
MPKIHKEKKSSWKKRIKTIIKFYWMALIPTFLIIGAFYWLIIKDLPSPTRLNDNARAQSTHIYDRNNNLLYTIYADKNQSFTPLNKIPKNLQHATIAIEDKDFYKHGAIDIRGIARAFYATIFKKDLQGGSTITQQLVKTTLLTPDRTIERKIKEILLAFATETLYSKDKILEMYLNQVPYGGTAYGVEAAAQTYFGKSVTQLDLAESAVLAGLPESPSVYSPFGTHPELAKKRQVEILNAMYAQKYITKKQRDDAIRQPLKYQKISTAIKAPHFVLYVKDLLVRKYGVNKVEQGGLKVITSLDSKIQDFAELAVASEVAKLERFRVGNGATLVTNPATGEILAMVGSKDYFNEEDDGNVNVTLALRQPGSSIKPINYAVGLIKGYTASTPFIDQAVCFPNVGSPPYCPRNYDGKFRGVIQMRNGLGNSINTSAVQMLKLNGIDSMIATASAMGINSFKEPERYGLSLTLGGGEVTMLELATAYGVFANEGYRVDLHPILKITDNTGKVIEEYNPKENTFEKKRVIPEGVGFIISDILADNNARIDAFGPNSELRIGRNPISVKTGTTNDYRDNWTVGYTKDALVAVWVGNNDNSPMGSIVSGVTGAAPIWNEIMSYLVKEKKVEPIQKPKNIIQRVVCSTSGLIPPPDGTPDRCPVRAEYFIKGTEPKQIDPGRQKVFIDKGTGDLAKPGQLENIEEKMEIVVTDPLNNRYCITCPHPSPTPNP